MNNEQNSEKREENVVDPRTISAEVIGELRKDKIGRPMLVIQMFIIFAIVLIALPIVNSLMNDETSFLYKLVHPSTAVTPSPSSTPSSGDQFLDGKELQQLSSATTMKYENIVMKNFALRGGNIECDIYSYNGVLELDKENLYLEVYASGTNNLIAAVKLIGTFDNQVQRVALTAHNLSFNGNYSYVGKIVEMNYNDYPAVTISSDESGIGSLICTMDNQTLEYTFKNNYLIAIKDSVKVNLSEQKDNNAYLNLKKTYEDKANNLGTNASVDEDDEGFLYQANLNLENYKVPTTVSDYNYFALDTEAKEIDYTLKGKGFDCK